MSERFRFKCKLPITKVQAACMAGGILLYAAMELVSVLERQNVFAGEGLKRAGPGQGDSIYEILVAGLDKEDKIKKI